MKEHELRELINKLTACAKKFATTQQLREQIKLIVTGYIEPEIYIPTGFVADEFVNFGIWNGKPFSTIPKSFLKRMIETKSQQWKSAIVELKRRPQKEVKI